MTFEEWWEKNRDRFINQNGIEHRVTWQTAQAEQAAEVERLRANSAVLRSFLLAIVTRLGEGQLEDGFGEDSRYAWTTRLQAALDQKQVGADLLRERDELRQQLAAKDEVLRRIQEMADDDIKQGRYHLDSFVFQIEADARAALHPKQ